MKVAVMTGLLAKWDVDVNPPCSQRGSFFTISKNFLLVQKQVYIKYSESVLKMLFIDKISHFKH